MQYIVLNQYLANCFINLNLSQEVPELFHKIYSLLVHNSFLKRLYLLQSGNQIVISQPVSLI